MKATEEKLDAYGVLTAKILDALKDGTVPWTKPWLSGPPRSLSTGKTYRGFNQLLLGFLGREHDTPFWGTYNQLGELGGAIKKGERSTPVSFWKQLEFPDEKSEDGTKKIMMCRYYRAFNCDQAEWQNGEPRMVKEWREKHAEVGQGNPHERADQMIASFPGRPAFEQRGMVAFYSPGDDKVVVPKPELFESQTAFYQTTFHEFVHSTGHPNRLNRFDIQSRPSTEEYSKEELVAELGAAFLCNEAGIEPRVDQSAAYCKSWLAKLTADPKILVAAASLAAKAADHFLGRDRQQEQQNDAVPKIAQVVPQISAAKAGSSREEEAEAEM